MSNQLGLIHRWIPAESPVSSQTVLLLHGTGGNEDDLLEVGKAIAPNANLLSPRGAVLENGMSRFFRRLAEGVFDIPDLIERAGELSRFISEASETYRFDRTKVIALGYSNGANIASATLLLHPESFAGIIVWRGMVPLAPKQLPDLNGKRVLQLSGQFDRTQQPGEANRLASLLTTSKATVDLQLLPAGHELTQADFAISRDWMAARQ